MHMLCASRQLPLQPAHLELRPLGRVCIHGSVFGQLAVGVSPLAMPCCTPRARPGQGLSRSLQAARQSSLQLDPCLTCPNPSSTSRELRRQAVHNLAQLRRSACRCACSQGMPAQGAPCMGALAAKVLQLWVQRSFETCRPNMVSV